MANYIETVQAKAKRFAECVSIQEVIQLADEVEARVKLVMHGFKGENGTLRIIALDYECEWEVTPLGILENYNYNLMF